MFHEPSRIKKVATIEFLLLIQSPPTAWVYDCRDACSLLVPLEEYNLTA